MDWVKIFSNETTNIKIAYGVWLVIFLCSLTLLRSKSSWTLFMIEMLFWFCCLPCLPFYCQCCLSQTSIRSYVRFFHNYWLKYVMQFYLVTLTVLLIADVIFEFTTFWDPALTGLQKFALVIAYLSVVLLYIL